MATAARSTARGSARSTAASRRHARDRCTCSVRSCRKRRWSTAARLPASSRAHSTRRRRSPTSRCGRSSPRFPAPSGDGAKDGAAGIHYLLNGQGKDLGHKIAADFGDASAATYELAVKINMLPMLYIDDPKDAMGDTMADVFGRLARSAKLPESAMGPLIAKLEARAPTNEVIDMALGLNESLPVAIAEIYEKDGSPTRQR